MTELRDLDVSECEALLRANDVGRVAISTPTGPHIIPVNYTIAEDAVIIRTSPYSVLGTYGRNTTLALEIDGFDHERTRGWSVQARGRVEVIEDYAEIARLREEPQPGPWAAGSRWQYMRLHWNELTGRRLGSGWNPLDDEASTRSTQRHQ